ncbi:hypothetical protein PENTCL1PPCAC_27767, partial [Pristionchus entomophagus]
GGGLTGATVGGNLVRACLLLLPVFSCEERGESPLLTMDMDHQPTSPPPSPSSHHTLDASTVVPPQTEDYVAFYTFSGSVPPAYRKDVDDDALLLQPSTLDFADYSEPFKSSSPGCSLCGITIDDPHLLSVSGRKYHEDCLRCFLCSSSLAGSKSCWMREEAVYCKGCYEQEFSTKCTGCDRSISAADWVRRARTNVYHIACFGCHQCKRQLSTGEEFAIQENKLLCKQHYLELVEGDSAASKQKTKRVRTTFTDEQINVLQTHFNIDSNPDGADLERIAQQTGLSKRVTQVWFQNSRARQKKYNVKKPGAHGRTDSLPSSEDALSPHSEVSSSEDGLIFPHSVTTTMEETMCTSNVPPQHRMDMRGMGL